MWKQKSKSTVYVNTYISPKTLRLAANARGSASITTKNGNKVSRKGNPEDPAVILDTGKSKAIKSSHELN